MNMNEHSSLIPRRSKNRRDTEHDENDEVIAPRELLHDWRRLLAEYLGTLIIVFADTAATVAQRRSNINEPDTMSTALSEGLILTALIYAFGFVSGAHFNPCITLGFALRGVFSWWRVPLYFISQLGGAVTASLLVWLIFFGFSTHTELYNLGAAEPNHKLLLSHFFPIGYSRLQLSTMCIGFEVLFSALITSVTLFLAERSRVVGPNAALGVGFSQAAANLVGKPVTGGAFNPMKWLAPALVSGFLFRTHNWWIYTVGPLCGTIIAVLMMNRLLLLSAAPREPKDEEEEEEVRKVSQGEGEL
eukprot:GEZU01014044.1.p1 GENE.GEZU01014044.1~~GEZU01014044.1.p1  ORF type:complete len:303 (-),score=31.26 GEZU01014044.1:75-983(-)